MRIAIKNDSMVAFLKSEADRTGLTPTMLINKLIDKEMRNCRTNIGELNHEEPTN